jgi:hypothetical protein
VLLTAQGFFPSQQFGIDLGEFLQLLLELAIALDAVFSRLLLSGCFELELIDPTHGQTLREVVKGAVLLSPMMAVTIGLATAGETLDQRGAQTLGQDPDLGEEEAFAFAQRQGGFGGVMNPSHIYGKDSKNAETVNEKENA